MGNGVDHGRAGPVTATCCPHCHTPILPQRRSRGEQFHSLFYWALIIVNVVVLSWGAMMENDPAPTLEEDRDCWREHRMPRIEFITLDTPEAPREVLERDFPNLPTLPIRGGWGYDLETACIIEPPDDPDIPFDGVDVEYAFAAHRIYEELMFMHPVDDDGYEDISLQLLRQVLVQEGGRYYDVLTFQVSARPEEWPDPVRPANDAGKGRRAPLHTGEREFWFDITSFFGKYIFDEA